MSGIKVESPLLDLRLADCMDVMREAPDNHWDLAIVDPPYGIGEDGAKNHTRGGACPPTMYAAKSWDNATPPVEYFNELRRVAQYQIIWGANHMMDKIMRGSPSWIIWDKENGGNDFADAELAYTSHKKAARVFRFRWAGMLQGDMKNKEKRIHPTQKPGDRILDTHMGSGSIAIACHYRGHHLTACEIDPDYFNAAVERINLNTRQKDMFSEPVQLTAQLERGIA